MNPVGSVLFDPVTLAEKLYLKKIIAIQPVSHLLSATIFKFNAIRLRTNGFTPNISIQKINLNPSKPNNI